ncbi:MAG: ABC transporter ATP-binding protein [Paraburkholderia sp.]|uniref:ABC transporter ATP-binding protein n=1 Tax=Paraburkholderia sp. TaxID=1926495 RepID=UPI00122618E0|nr:ABC transporter ATP-binding protein [Paraburkholderia sp.]TAM07531.1 MAG: ABC transporter ATP-binding protein [Paraburkholderia sp.]TAM54528.1 MAG: ABC transporter ATP-binding protein [Paraburkholderia sp.]
MAHHPVIDICDVSFRRDGRDIVRNVELKIERAELVALVGLNGAGKTTLLSLLATLAVPHGGQIYIDGVDAVAYPAQARARIGVVFQESALEMRLSALDNLLFIAQLQGLRGRTARRRVDELLGVLALDALAGTPVQSLSGGQRRRVELARALVSRPPVLLLDEAALGLDVCARHAFWSEIRTLVADGHAVLHTTHQAEEAREAHRVVVLDHGAVRADGPWRSLCGPISSAIRLHVTDVGVACRWLAARGYAVKAEADAAVVSCTDPQASLPTLLQRIPFEVLGADIVTPDLMGVIAHWTGTPRQETPPARLAAKAAQ